MRGTTALAGLLAGAALSACGGDLRPAEATIRLATTTSARDTGLLDALLPAFREETAIEVQAIAVGTGEALRLGERGDADVVLVHARKAEDEFLAKGFGVERRDVWWNRFVVLGPPDDPADVRGTPLAHEALARIRAAGTPFVSRGDDSGTHSREMDLWTSAGGLVRWDDYLRTGQGMSATLTIADEMGAYVLSDEGTYLRVRKSFVLVPLVAGDEALRNEYGAILVRPSGDAVKDAAARRFLAWLGSPRARSIVSSLRLDGRRAFFLPGEAAEPGDGP